MGKTFRRGGKEAAYKHKKIERNSKKRNWFDRDDERSNRQQQNEKSFIFQ